MLGDQMMADGQVMLGNPEMALDYQIIMIASIVILLIFPLLLLWGWRKGQFKDIEEAKFRVLEMEEEYAD